MRYQIVSLTALLALLVSAPTAGSNPGREERLEAVALPSERVAITAPVEGLLEAVLVDIGDRVRRGQVVAVLESRVEQVAADLARVKAERKNELRIAEARLESAARRLEQSEKLFSKGLLSAEQLDEAATEKLLLELTVQEKKLDRTVALFEYRRAQALLEQRSLRAPFDGFVTERHLSPGALAIRGESGAILELARIDPLFIDVHAPISMLGRIEQGQTVPVDLESGARDIAATVHAIDRVANPASGTFRVRLSLGNAENKITAGQRCTVDFGRVE